MIMYYAVVDPENFKSGMMQVCNPPPSAKKKKKKDGWSDEDSKMTKILPFC